MDFEEVSKKPPRKPRARAPSVCYYVETKVYFSKTMKKPSLLLVAPADSTTLIDPRGNIVYYSHSDTPRARTLLLYRRATAAAAANLYATTKSCIIITLHHISLG